MRVSHGLLSMVVALATGACAGDAQDGRPSDSVPKTGPWGGGRSSVVQEEIAAWNQHLSPAARAEKLDKMAEDPFSFYRGSNHLFWMDLGQSPLLQTYGGPQAVIWLQGDLHVNNYGVFDDDEGRIVYDLNDFDEAIIGDYQLDLWRLATSAVLVGRDNGLDEDEIASAVDGLTEAYLDALDDFRHDDDEADFVVDESNAYGRLDELLDAVTDQESRREMLDDWTTTIDGVQTLDLALDDLEAVDAATEAAIVAALPGYGQTLSGGLTFDAGYFAAKGVARWLHVGIGSLGNPRYALLIEGPSDDPDDDVLLDIKQQREPTGVSYLDEAASAQLAAWFPDAGERVVRAHKALGRRVDDHLGWLVLDDGSYSVRARSPYKASFPLDELDTETRLMKLGEQWGSILAAAHARSDEDHHPEWIPRDFDDEIHDRTNGEHAEFRAQVRAVAFDYATQVETDYGFFLAML